LKFPDVSGAPMRALRGFQRVYLEPGASQKLDFRLNARDLSMVTDVGDIVVAEGNYTVAVGGGQPDTVAPSVAGTFQVKGAKTLPE
jgi:beta-glucosidase